MSKATTTGTSPPAVHDADRHDLIRVRGRAREQPQGRQRRDPEAPADGVHRRLRLGQELAGVRHDRRGVAAADQRDLQRLRAGLHADAGAARGRRAGGADDRDPRRPGADGRQRPLDGRHRHRRQRDAAHPLQPARQAAHRLAPGVLVQHRDDQRGRCGHVREGRQEDEGEALVHAGRRHVPALRGHGIGDRLRPVALYDDSKSLNEGALTIPGYSMDGWYGRIFRGCGYFDPDKPIRKFTKKELDDLLYREPTKIKVDGHQPDVRGADPEDPEVDAVEGRRRDAAAHPRLRGAGGDVHHVSRLRRHPAQRGRPVVQDQGDQHRRRLRDADQRPGRVGARPRRAVGGAAAGVVGRDPRLVRGDRAGLPLARPADGHAVGRRGAAHQDDPPARVVAHRRDLRVRRADGRAAPARHRSG